MSGFFKVNDYYSEEVCGFEIPRIWWSRTREYPWAIQYAKGIVADMGAGWMGRPFKNALCKKCESVYAVDIDPRINDLERWENIIYVTGDFTKKIDEIPAHSLDRVFCISVLEDLGGNLEKALAEFKRVLKPDGLIVITMDIQYDITKPLGKYPGGSINELLTACAHLGLQFADDIDFSKEDAVFHSDYNLCVFHCVLENADE